MAPSAFIIGPILSVSHDDHAYFRQLHLELIKPFLEELGFTTVRADEIAGGGSIGKDVIRNLAEADLVVADLTGMNPNVFYELGIRHALRASGTVTILNTSRTPDVPFDLKDYRVITFGEDMFSASKLKTELRRYSEAVAANTEDSETRDNPVHDWLPRLPPDVLAASDESEVGKLYERLNTVTSQLSMLKERYGVEIETDESQSPRDIVRRALEDVQEGSDAATVMDQIREAADTRNKVGVLEGVDRILSLRHGLSSPDGFMTLAQYVMEVDEPDVARAVFDAGIDRYPHNDLLLQSRLLMLMRHENPDTRRQGADEIMQRLGIRIMDDGSAIIDGDLQGAMDELLFGYLVDYLGSEDEESRAMALQLAEKAHEIRPESSLYLRGLAIALVNTGSIDEASEYFQRSLWCKDTDDQAAAFFGGYLHRTEDYVGSLEAFAGAAVLDPNDGSHFANMLDEISYELAERAATRPFQLPRDADDGSTRELPAGIDKELISQIAVAALSRPSGDVNQLLFGATSRLPFDLEVSHLSESAVDFDSDDRLRLAWRVYELVQSELTQVPSVEVMK